jgi:hypothetical protein
MIGRKTVVGLSLLASLCFCAIGAQGASAAWQTATNTTAYTCVPNGGAKDFSDAHCDNKVAEGTGSFGHVAITAGTKTSIESSGGTATLHGEAFATELTVTCHEAVPDKPGGTNPSYIENTNGGTTHEVHGTSAVIFQNCTVSQPANCTTKAITVKSRFHGVEEPNHSPGRTMALQFEQDEAPYATITLEGGSCALAGIPLEVFGKAKGTSNSGSQETRWAGSTVKFEPGAMEELEFGGEEAEFTATLETKMEGGNPIALTTPTP